MSAKIFIDKSYQKAAQRDLTKLAPGILDGEGAFETILYDHGEIYFLKEHLERLKKGLQLYKLGQPFTQKKIKVTATHLAQTNGFTTARLRVMVWRDKDKKKHHCIVVSRSNRPGKEKYERGYHAYLSPLIRELPQHSSFKTLDYQVYQKAHREAVLKGFDEGIMLNASAHLMEAAYSNIFLVKKDKLYTPPVKSGCLKGITRDAVLKLARQLKMPVKTKNLKQMDLFKADEAFLTNSVMEIMPLTFVNSRKIGAGRPGPVTERLMLRYPTFRK